ncbi:MAG: hypothetical protein ABEJ23_02280 [Haloarculaceae archaeon]
MADSRPTPTEDESDEKPPLSDDDADLSTDELRERVEAEYDFENFGPEDMARMTAAEWEAVFDPDSWITGEELLDRVEADLATRIVNRDVFARLERLSDPDRLVAYSDEGYAVVYADGSVEGRGTVRRDVEPSVALSSMEDYDVPDGPAEDALPDPMEVPEGSGEFGNLMIQVVAGAQALAGLGLVGAWLVTDIGLIPLVAGLAFLLISLFLFLVVANARLSDRFRAEEYRNRLRAAGVGAGEVPAFLEDGDDVPAAVVEAVRADEDGTDDDGPTRDAPEGA